MKTRTARLGIATILWTWGALISGGSAVASPVEGTWIAKDNVALKIFECGGRVCAQIAWVRDAARRPTQCGRKIVWGLLPTASNQWEGGSIVDPDNETVYQLAAELGSDGTLRVHIFKGISYLGKTEVLKRIDAHSLSGAC
jgi:uncharacterized protein (DUF2147 family)